MGLPIPLVDLIPAVSLHAEQAGLFPTSMVYIFVLSLLRLYTLYCCRGTPLPYDVRLSPFANVGLRRASAAVTVKLLLRGEAGICTSKWLMRWSNRHNGSDWQYNRCFAHTSSTAYAVPLPLKGKVNKFTQYVISPAPKRCGADIILCLQALSCRAFLHISRYNLL